MSSASAPSLRGGVLQVLLSDGFTPPQKMNFDKSVITIGRSSENDICCSNDSKMSRVHIEIEQKGQMILVSNLSQKNHVVVNGEVIEQKLFEGKITIEAGDHRFEVNLVFPQKISKNESLNQTQKTVASNPAVTSSHSTSTAVSKSEMNLRDIERERDSLRDRDEAVSRENIRKKESEKGQALALVEEPILKTEILKPSALAPQKSSATPVKPPPPVPPPAKVGGGPLNKPTAPGMSQALSGSSSAGVAQNAINKNSNSHRSVPSSAGAGASRSGRSTFYGIIIVIGLGMAWLLNSETSSKKKSVEFRTEEDVSKAVDESVKAIQEIQNSQRKSGMDSVQYKAAQENYIKGFRDYRQGQYARAMQSFQAALALFPNHELAIKYYNRSKSKIQSQIDEMLSLGRSYYQKSNYKLCQSSFANAMVMIKDLNDPKYKEAKQFYNECSLRLEGRF